VRTLAEARTTVLAPVSLPASGLAAVRVAAGTANGVPDNAATATDRVLSNGLVEVRIAEDGTLDITGVDGTVLRGVGRLVDGGDRGDSYNYGPPAQDVLVETPSAVKVELVENGPLRARVKVTRVYDWPVAIDAEDRDHRTEDRIVTPVEMLVEVRAGEPFARLGTSFLNQSAGHRLRLHVPLPVPAAMSAGSGQFSVTERGLTAEGGWGEYPIPTFPADEFVSAGMATVLLDHSTEYELVDGGAELAITLLRAIGSISVNIHPYRDEPAATEIAAPGAQDLGVRIEHRFAIIPSATGWQGARAVAWAAQFRHEVLAIRGTGRSGDTLPEDRAGLGVEGDDLFVSSIRRVVGGTELRLVAMSDAGASARLTGAFTEATTVDLLGRPLSTVSAVGELELDLGRWEIRTVVVR
jgi:alpha-mannosidase